MNFWTCDPEIIFKFVYKLNPENLGAYVDYLKILFFKQK